MTYPIVVRTLREFDLISDEQLEKALSEWDKSVDDHYWWEELAGIAWSFRPFYKRWFGLPGLWKFYWIKERRGW